MFDRSKQVQNIKGFRVVSIICLDVSMHLGICNIYIYIPLCSLLPSPSGFGVGFGYLTGYLEHSGYISLYIKSHPHLFLVPLRSQVVRKKRKREPITLTLSRVDSWPNPQSDKNLISLKRNGRAKPQSFQRLRNLHVKTKLPPFLAISLWFLSLTSRERGGGGGAWSQHCRTQPSNDSLSPGAWKQRVIRTCF